MRTIGSTGLIRVETHQWPRVEDALRLADYLVGREKGSNRKLVWCPERKVCVGQYEPMDNCYYLDERVRHVLPRPLGRRWRPDPWIDIGGEG